MIQLNDDLFLLPQNEIIQGSIGWSVDTLYQHTFASWVQFLELGKVTKVNLGVLAQWEDDIIVEKIQIEDKARKIFQTQVEAFAEICEGYYEVTPYIIDKTLIVLGRQDQYFFDYFRKVGLYYEAKSLLNERYYGSFIENMFGVPVHFVRHHGKQYYFVQKFDDKLIVPNIVSLENSRQIILSWVQKLNLPQITLWTQFRQYIRKTFGVRIQYGKPENKYYNQKYSRRK